MASRRVWRMLKDSTRLNPAFIIIGAQRAGTTSLYSYLVEHPAILPAQRKEIHFFNRNYSRGMVWYRRHFPTALKHPGARWRGLITGESTPAYLFYPLAAARLHQALPGVKLIVLLRNPVDRAYSHYQHERRRGLETLSFEDAIAQESARIDGERARIVAEPDYHSPDYENYSYLARGFYAEQLARWLEYFPREQLLVLQSETFYDDVPGTLATVFDFLGLPPHTLPTYPQYNQASYPAMDPATRARLRDTFAPHNVQLTRLLDHDFGWDR